MLKKSLLILGLASVPALSATFSITGNDRFGSDLFQNLNMVPGSSPGVGDTSAFLENRILIRPDVVVDDRFTVRTEFVLGAFHTGQNDLPPQFGTAFGNRGAFYLNKAYLDWASDWGILSAGRMAKNWGLGILYNAGNDPFDDYATIRDRLQFRALVGNLAIQLAYEKDNEGVLNYSGDDADAYDISVEYSNPESLFDVGILYERDVRMVNAPDYLGKSAHVISLYSRKRWDKFQLGGEFVNVNTSDTSEVGALAQVDYQPSAWEWGFDFAYASGSSDSPFRFNADYRPFLIMFNQSIGSTFANNVASVRGGQAGNSSVGSPIGYGNGSGALLGKLSGSYGFENKTLRLGLDMGMATLANQGTNAGRMLGFETDAHLTQKWYENFKTYYALGMLFPGSAFTTASQIAWGVQIRGALTF